MDVIEDIYEGDNNYRYILGRSPLFILGINPSSAEPGFPDPTIRFIERNFDSWIMLNIYPQRTSNSKNLAPESEFDQKKHEENTKLIINCIEKYSGKTTKIVAAWGDSIKERHYLFSCLYDLILVIKNKRKEVKWYRIGELTKNGNPKHPAYYLRKGESNIKDYLIQFSIDEYLEIKKKYI